MQKAKESTDPTVINTAGKEQEKEKEKEPVLVQALVRVLELVLVHVWVGVSSRGQHSRGMSRTDPCPDRAPTAAVQVGRLESRTYRRPDTARSETADGPAITTGPGRWTSRSLARSLAVCGLAPAPAPSWSSAL